MRSDLLGAGLALCLFVSWAPATAAQGAPSAAEVARGRYVFGATGGCGCHTVPKGQLNAGGRRYDGPFGTVYSTNITPDRQTGIGTWTDEQIITAIRLGRSAPGRAPAPGAPVPGLQRDGRGGPARARRLPAHDAGRVTTEPGQADRG